MTTSLPMTAPSQPPDPSEERPRHSLTAMPTHLITLSPAFLEALRKVAPAAQRRRAPYVLALALVLAAMALAALPAFRQRALALAHRVTHRGDVTAVATSSAPSVAPLDAVTPTASAAAPSAPSAPAVARNDDTATSSAGALPAAAPSVAPKPSRTPGKHPRTPR